MRRWTALVLALLLWVPARAESFDLTGLKQMPGLSAHEEFDGSGTVYRPPSQPYAGTVSLPDGELTAFLDFFCPAGEDITLLRLSLSLVSCDYIAAGEMTVTAGGKDYVFQVQPQVTEYDLTYYEDYAVCLTDESLPMLKAMARSRQDTFPIRLAGSRQVEGSITLPLDEVAALYDTYVDLGGPAQRLDHWQEDWPVTILDNKQ